MPRAEGLIRFEEIGSQAGEQLKGEMVDITFQEVTISESYQTQVVTDGESLHLDLWSFDIVLETPTEAEGECGGHGQIHGDHCHCDEGYQLDANDSTRCIPVD